MFVKRRCASCGSPFLTRSHTAAKTCGQFVCAERLKKKYRAEYYRENADKAKAYAKRYQRKQKGLLTNVR